MYVTVQTASDRTTNLVFAHEPLNGRYRLPPSWIRIGRKASNKNRVGEIHHVSESASKQRLEYCAFCQRGDCPGKTELSKEILLRSDIFVEYSPQTRIEGEIQQLDNDYPVHELWQVIRGELKGRKDSRQITLFDSVGFAIEDFSALRYIRDQLGKPGMGGMCEYLDMIADPDDPRDLYGMVVRSGNMTKVAQDSL